MPFIHLIVIYLCEPTARGAARYASTVVEPVPLINANQKNEYQL